MVANKGELVLLKLRTGVSPAVYTTVGGMRALRIAVNRPLVEATDAASGNWRKALANAGIASLRVQGNGIYTHSAGEQAVRGAALTGTAQRFRLYFGDGSYAEADFIVTAYERSGKVAEAAAFSLTLESVGEVIFTAG